MKFSFILPSDGGATTKVVGGPWLNLLVPAKAGIKDGLSPVSTRSNFVPKPNSHFMASVRIPSN
jgi:hypothetical protein